MDRNIITEADVESANELTVNLSDVIRQVRELESARATAEKHAAVAKAVARTKGQPLAWSAALVLIVLALSVVVGWVAYLAYM